MSSAASVRLPVVLLAVLSVASSAGGQSANPTGAQGQSRIRVERADQLPVHVYRVATTATALFQDDAQFAQLAQQLDADLRADLAAYDIQDLATLKSYYGALSNLAVRRGDYKTALEYQDRIRALEDKPGLKLLTGLTERTLAAATRGPSPNVDQDAFRAALRGEIAALPYTQVQAELAQMKSRLELLAGPNIVLGAIQAQIEPSARAGSISRELAQQLVSFRVLMDRILPVRQVLLDEFTRTIAAHAVEKPDIWTARDVSLDARAGLTPVVVGIWDTGVDAAVYPAQLFTNVAEIPDNGKDDDGNGYVDDVHGIAHDLDGNRDTGLLFQLSAPDEEAKYRGFVKGLLDLQAGLENADVSAFRQNMAAMPSADVKPFLEKLQEYIVWSHGTHVAGIALRGNPAARMLVSRIGTDQFKMPPRAPSLALAPKQAEEMRETIDYFRQHGVRVINMSWGFAPGFFEKDLEANNVGGTPQERRTLARQIFDIGAVVLRDAMTAAPDILFVAAAGNWDQDNKFGEFVPAAFDLPNLITVGAVDRGGDEAAFTSYGKVDVYANGYEVPSKVPGGAVIPLSGTSMATPQVVNLAAKLLAVRPNLTVAELRRAILDAADQKVIGQDKRIKLLNPKASLESLN